PNLKETNSAKIVSGFGGTVCLVLSFFYIAVSMVILLIPAVQQHHLGERLPLEALLALEWTCLGALFILTVVVSGTAYFLAHRRAKSLAFF
ncbi:MAG: putative ABC transporter permease subunit, partial [Roseimicrobium sp.]